MVRVRVRVPDEYGTGTPSRESVLRDILVHHHLQIEKGGAGFRVKRSMKMVSSSNFSSHRVWMVNRIDDDTMSGWVDAIVMTLIPIEDGVEEDDTYSYCK